ncbi:hypothetical protein KY329_01995 [Candidatus Woesearchaeota archaeon]|nr:hypothetical protein [Candidatus Woesearchaeota archaeon]
MAKDSLIIPVALLIIGSIGIVGLFNTNTAGLAIADSDINVNAGRDYFADTNTFQSDIAIKDTAKLTITNVAHVKTPTKQIISKETDQRKDDLIEKKVSMPANRLIGSKFYDTGDKVTYARQIGSRVYETKKIEDQVTKDGDDEDTEEPSDEEPELVEEHFESDGGRRRVTEYRNPETGEVVRSVESVYDDEGTLLRRVTRENGRVVEDYRPEGECICQCLSRKWQTIGCTFPLGSDVTENLEALRNESGEPDVWGNMRDGRGIRATASMWLIKYFVTSVPEGSSCDSACYALREQRCSIPDDALNSQIEELQAQCRNAGGTPYLWDDDAGNTPDCLEAY